MYDLLSIVEHKNENKQTNQIFTFFIVQTKTVSKYPQKQVSHKGIK